MLRKLIYTILLMVYTIFGYAQDINFTQFHTNFLEVNPSFAGSANQPRASVNYRNQWPGVNKAFVSYSSSYDQPLKPKFGNIGVKISNDVQNSGVLNFLEFDAIYSYQIRIANKWYMVGALQAGISQNSLKAENINFADEIDPIFGYNYYSTNEAVSSAKKLYPDFASGISFYHGDHYFGFAVDHLLKPYASFFSKQTNSRIERKYSVNYGYTIPIHINGWVRPLYYISPSILFQKQGGIEQILYGTYVNSLPMTYGVWFRQSFDFFPNSVILLLGYKKNNIKISYTYDLTLTRLSSTYGTHEIAFIYLFADRKLEQKPYKSKLKTPWF